MALADQVHVARRYQLAIRVDTDLANPAALEGFVCPRSSGEVLRTMARHVAESGQGAFTWTGPYGSGKSSLAVALGTVLNGDEALRRRAESILGQTTSTKLAEAMPPRSRGWRMLPVMGRRDRPERVIGESIVAGNLLPGKAPRVWTEPDILDALKEIAALNPRASGGLLVLIDEMGKFLEAAAHDGSDIHLFQQLAELASRSGGRLIVVGILHQAFEEYAHLLSRQMRDEWAKIQGRYVDLVVNTTGDEQIDLIGRAIRSEHSPRPPGSLAEKVAGLLPGQASPYLPEMLEDCWPLHPVVACLLGPLSRRRFGQNQRSLFGFLNSAEPQGFQDFLRHASEDDLYEPARLWDYLRINLEPSILASPDGHRWALAADALGRCDAMGGGDHHLRVLKAIAIIDLLKDRSGLVPSIDLLKLAVLEVASDELVTVLDDLQSWSLIVFRKFVDAFAIFEGSDFDIDQALEQASSTLGDIDLNSVGAMANLQPIVAKRHYHRTGALRWFDLSVVPLAEIERIASDYSPRHGAIGSFFLVIPMQHEARDIADKICHAAVQQTRSWDTVVGLSPSAWGIPDLAAELAALERVRDDSPDLQHDRVARREVLARIAAVEGHLEGELGRAFDSATWYRINADEKPLFRSELNSLASDLADARFKLAPKLRNELVGRVKPSSNAVAARNALLRRMVLNQGEARLGIKGFPAEGGLFASLLEAAGLYQETMDGWRFVAPDPKENDVHNLAPAWWAAKECLKTNSFRAVPLSEIYEIWREAPIGIKEGLLPVLAVAFILSERGTLAFYREGIFQIHMSDLDVDFLVRDPDDVQLRWMDLSEVSRQQLSRMADVVRELDESNRLSHLEPIDVARGLVAIYDELPPWVERTQRLSRNAVRIRQIFKHAKDPNKLIFDDLPNLLSDAESVDQEEIADQIASHVREGLAELTQAYSAMLNRLRETLLTELRVPNASVSMLAELRDRAKNIRELGGDHRLEAFIVRLTAFNGSDADMENLAGMAVNKPPQQWVDADIDRAAVELADMAQRFVRAEVFAHVKGRADKRHAMAVVVGMDGRPMPAHKEFAVADHDRADVRRIMDGLEKVLLDSGEGRGEVILAALAELSVRYLDAAVTDESKRSSKKELAG